MLRIFCGAAGTGKTAAVIAEMNAVVQAGREEGKIIYLVPEQYSHEAERELSAVCGPRASLYAEVMSFTGLARRVSETEGGSTVKYLDEGGKLLCMALTMDLLGGNTGRLKEFRYAARKSDMWELLVKTVDDLKSAGITADDLRASAGELNAPLKNKVLEIAEICEDYSSRVAVSGADSADRLFRTAQQLKTSEAFARCTYYVDGFTDFTQGEFEVICTLLKRGCSVTMCLTADGEYSEKEAFALAAATWHDLSEFCKENKIMLEIREFLPERSKTDGLSVFTENMFNWTENPLSADTNVRVFRCGSAAAECELAAAEAARLVRENKCRWRDIAVAVRGFSDYRALLRSVFEYYGVPLFMADSTDIMSLPLPSLLSSAFEIARTGWKADDVITYMRSGLTGLTREECDELESYVFRWQLDERSWHRAGSWSQHPAGYRSSFSEEESAQLARVNNSAKKLAEPLMRFTERGRVCTTAREHCENLAVFMENLRLNETFAASVAEAPSGSAAGLRRIWDICVTALEQCEAVLGDTEMSMSDFGKLFERMLSKYRISTIPMALDRVSAGDFDRMRRRNIRHLIVLGATDARLPAAHEGAGVFSEAELAEMREHALVLDKGDRELFREFTLIYNCLSLPSETLTLSRPLADGDGNGTRPSFFINQAVRIFGTQEQEFDLNAARIQAEQPALSLAADRFGSVYSQAAAEYFRSKGDLRPEKLKAAAEQCRGSLSPASVRKLYGREITVSASKTDTFADCRFKYFCRYGLRAEPYTPVGFNPPEVGTFVHSIFEKTVAQVQQLGGFRSVSDDKITEIADSSIDEYIHNELGDFSEKTERFVYLFNRLRESVHPIILDAAAELRCTAFAPIDYELDFYNEKGMPRFTLSDGENSMVLSGIADRVDALEKNGKLYLRIVDYKTGKKKLALGDLYNGKNMQMLLYLMAIEANGAARYGKPVEGAGVVFFPARNEYVTAKTAESGEKEHEKNLRRSGLVLDCPEVLDNWDTGEEKCYIPLSTDKNGRLSGDNLVNKEQMELLQEHIKKVILDMSGDVSRGSIEANPVYKTDAENACSLCDYRDACGFADGVGGEQFRHRSTPKAKDVWEKLGYGPEQKKGKEETVHE